MLGPPGGAFTSVKLTRDIQKTSFNAHFARGSGPFRSR